MSRSEMEKTHPPGRWLKVGDLNVHYMDWEVAKSGQCAGHGLYLIDEKQVFPRNDRFAGQ